MKESKVIHISEVLRGMNTALANGQTVTFKAWRLGEGREDPERGAVRIYTDVRITSHSKFGSYNVYDPLLHEFRHVNEAFIFEFMGRRVYW